MARAAKEIRRDVDGYIYVCVDMSKDTIEVFVQTLDKNIVDDRMWTRDLGQIIIGSTTVYCRLNSLFQLLAETSGK